MAVIFRICLILILELAITKAFKIYWNIPTFMCQRHGFDFSYVTQRYGIIQNMNDTFRGDKFAILYDPGKFPAILQSSSGFFLRNGGVPQEGNLAEHMQVLEKHINELITDVDFDGVAVIDFESWRPVFRQNFGSLQPYKDLSFKIERQKHPFFSNAQIQAEAAKRFQKSGRLYVEDTIMLAKKMRPKAQWGYYAFPYCFNGNANNPESCADNVRKENDGIKYMFAASDLVMPSVYIAETKISPENRPRMVRGRVKEAMRVSNQLGHKPPVLTYVRYVYTDTRNLLSETDMLGVMNSIKSAGSSGVILWGSSNDLRTKEKCQEFHDYLENVMGPIITTYSKRGSFEDYVAQIG